MEQYLNKKCKVKIEFNKRHLWYNALITHVTPTHISFKDKFNVNYTFRIAEVLEIVEEVD